MRFIEFPGDEVALALSEIVSVRAIDESDLDHAGTPVRGIPARALTRIDLRGGHFWISEEWSTVMERIHGHDQ